MVHWRLGYLGLLVIFVPSLQRVDASLRGVYLWDLCPGNTVQGPNHGWVILTWDGATPNRTVKSRGDCWISFQGIDHDSVNGDQQMLELSVRQTNYVPYQYNGTANPNKGFTLSGPNTNKGGTTEAECPDGFIQLWSSKDGTPDTKVWTRCGTTGIPPIYTTASPYLVLRVWTNDGVSDPCLGGALCDPSMVKNLTNLVGSKNPFDPNYNVSVGFTVDITSYFNGVCSFTDRNQFQCTPGTGRCIHISMRCDIYFSNNCGKSEDMIAGPPALCTATSTAVQPTTIPDPYIALWVVLGILGALLLLFCLIWLCWRPGWIPWLLAGCRHLKCCKSCVRKCNKIPCCTPQGGCTGPTGCCGKNGCCSCCASSGRGAGATTKCCKPCAPWCDDHCKCCCRPPRPDTPLTGGDGDGKGMDPNGFGAGAPPWLQYLQGDGGHVREGR